MGPSCTTVFGEKVNNQIERNQDLDKVSTINGAFNDLFFGDNFEHVIVIVC